MQSPKSDGLFREILKQIESGKLPPGSRLPTHRELARQKRVSLSVVNRVYGELQRTGFTQAAGRRGTVTTPKALLKPLTTGPAVTPDSDVIDLSHNYAALPELNAAIKSLFADALPSYVDEPTHARTEQLIQQAGRQWLSLLSLPSSDLAVLGCWGGQHGIQACLLALSGLNQQIAVEPFTYTGLKLAASVLGIELVSVDADGEGMRPDALERIARQTKIKAVYLMPSFQNPFGTTMPAGRRRQLAEVCQKAGLFVIEDDPHRYLIPQTIPSFLDLLPDRSAHVTTMSKVLGPVMRLGFVATSPRLALRLQSAIRSSNWILPLLEATVTAAAVREILPNSIVKLQAHARQRQKITRKIFKDHELIGSAAAPHLCLKLGDNWKSSQLSAVSLEYGFRISAGHLYATGKAAEDAFDFIRVSLMSEPIEARFIEGLRRLKELMDGTPAAFLSAS